MATFVLENGKLAVVLDSTSTVSGTPENDAQKELQAKIKDLRSGIDKLVADMKSGDENLIKQAEAKYEEIDRKITETVVNYILAHTDKQSAAKNLYDFRYNIDEEQQNEIISKADSSFKSVPGISYMIDHLNVLKKVAIGQKFTDFEMPNAKGEVHKLSEYVGNGKVVLIDFGHPGVLPAVQKCRIWSKPTKITRTKDSILSVSRWTAKPMRGPKA